MGPRESQDLRSPSPIMAPDLSEKLRNRKKKRKKKKKKKERLWKFQSIVTDISPTISFSWIKKKAYPQFRGVYFFNSSHLVRGDQSSLARCQ